MFRARHRDLSRLIAHRTPSNGHDADRCARLCFGVVGRRIGAPAPTDPRRTDPSSPHDRALVPDASSLGPREAAGSAASGRGDSTGEGVRTLKRSPLRALRRSTGLAARRRPGHTGVASLTRIPCTAGAVSPTCAGSQRGCSFSSMSRPWASTRMAASGPGWCWSVIRRRRSPSRRGCRRRGWWCSTTTAPPGIRPGIVASFQSALGSAQRSGRLRPGLRDRSNLDRSRQHGAGAERRPRPGRFKASYLLTHTLYWRYQVDS